MSTAATTGVFIIGAAASLITSWVVVSRIERVGARLGATEALLGVVAALAGDAPEITSAVSALLDHQGAVAAGVSIGSNVFNLAALLGLNAVISGRIVLHRRAILLEGTVAIWIALACFCTVLGVFSPPVGLGVVAVALAPYLVVMATSRSRRWQRAGASRWEQWVSAAIVEEEVELTATIHPARGQRRDALTGASALVVVVLASVAMEHAASRLGSRLAVPDIIVGGVVLAAVTSLPNAVAAIYWARRARGVAMLSTGLNSNAFNVTVGLLLPAVILGLGHRSGPEVVTAAWYLGLTVLALVLAYRQAALNRAAGCLVIGLYLAFVAVIAWS
jgi:cation:H+ antiporter